MSSIMSSVMFYTGGASASGAAAPTKAPTTGSIPGELSLAEMFAWLSKTMSQSDSEIRSKMEEIQDAKNRSETLQQLIQELRVLQNKAKSTDDKGTGLVDKSMLSDVKGSFASQPWFDKLSPGAKTAIAGFYGDLKGDGRVHLDSIDHALKALDEETKMLGSGNEMNMIKLQSLMSARSQAIQLVSNMLQSFNDASMKIVGNVR